jgi:hypothetical protein
MMDAGMPMPALVSWMPMPTYAHCEVSILYTVQADRLHKLDTGSATFRESVTRWCLRKDINRGTRNIT